MQLLRQPGAQPYEIVRLPENPLRYLTHCLSFLCVLTKILCVKYAVTPLNGKAGCDISDAELSLSGFHMFRVDRATRGGGVVLYVSEKYEAVVNP